MPNENPVTLTTSTSDIVLDAAPSTTSTTTPTPIESPYQGNDPPQTTSSSDQSGITLSLVEVLYSASSYHAIAKPVSLTMILSAISVILINTEETLRQGEQEMAAYYFVWKPDGSSSEQQSTGQALAMSIGNSLVIVSFICAMTFVIVLLYKFRFMKCLIGYMILSSSTLLGILGGRIAVVFFEKYRIPVDLVTFYFVLYNFAIVGTIAIFFQHGIPTYITQGYLVVTSVILAWQFAHFDAWTTWTLLVVLALYDLCAVLTPCGPLKALVGLMQQDDSPEMPGLLYEAHLPPEAQRPGTTSRSNSNNSGSRRENDGGAGAARTANRNAPVTTTTRAESVPPNAGTVEMSPTSESNPSPQNTAFLPLAIARIYHLPILSPDTPTPTPSPPSSLPEPNVSTSPLLEDSNTPQPQPTPTELRSDVRVVFPANGGRIEKRTVNGNVRYFVLDRHGEVKRVLLIDRRGKVFEEVKEDDEEDDAHSNSIKLGLGDFIFYSVLVSKAAMYSFTTFAACTLVILAGLGVTLVLLSVYHKALPALPISIFLGVVFYLLTRLVIEPWIEDVMRVPFYV